MTASADRSTRWDRLVAGVDAMSSAQSFLVVFLVLLSLYLPSATFDYEINIDAGLAAMPAWHLVERGTLEITDQKEFLEARQLGLQNTIEIDGRLYSNRNAGVILWGVPFYAAFSPFIDADAPMPMYPAAVAGAVAASLAMAVLHVALRRLVTPSAAVVGALVAGLGTGTWAVSADGLWSHGPSQLWLACGLVLVARRWYVASGAALGAALVTRPYNAFAAAAMGLYASWRDRKVGPALKMGAIAVLALGALVLWNDRIYGIPSVAGGYARYEYTQTAADPTSRSYLGVAWNLGRAFLDPQRGMLVYSPFLIMLALGLRRAWSVADDWVRGAALGGLMVLLVQYWVQSGIQGGDYFFSYRYPLEALTLAAPLLTVAWREWIAPVAQRRRIFWMLVGTAVGLQIFGAVIEPYTLST